MACWASVKSSRRSSGSEVLFHIDENDFQEKGEYLSRLAGLQQAQMGSGGLESIRDPDEKVSNKITAVAASDKVLLIGRESGQMHKYALQPTLKLERTFTIGKSPAALGINCDSSRAIVTDIGGSAILIDLEGKTPGSMTGKQVDGFERKDVWHFRWARDNPDLFAIMEKARMYVVRGTEPEEPVACSGHIADFCDLQIRSALLDDIFQNGLEKKNGVEDGGKGSSKDGGATGGPEGGSGKEVASKKGGSDEEGKDGKHGGVDHPRNEFMIDFETKSLRDTRDILAKVHSLKDAFNYVDENPHPRL